MIKQIDLAKHLDLSERSIRDFLSRAGISRGDGGYDLDVVRVTYIRHLREVAAGRSSENESVDLVEERALLAREQRIGHEKKNRLLDGELLEASDVVAWTQAAFARVRARLLAIPPRAAPIVARIDNPAEVQERLTEITYEALEELASTKFGVADDEGGEG